MAKTRKTKARAAKRAQSAPKKHRVGNKPRVKNERSAVSAAPQDEVIEQAKTEVVASGQSNFERLISNQVAAQNHLKVYLLAHPQLEIRLPESTDSLEQFKQKLSNGVVSRTDYSLAIQHLRQKLDYTHGVSWNIAVMPDGTRNLIRDARNCTAMGDEEPIAHQIICLNLARAASLLLHGQASVTVEINNQISAILANDKLSRVEVVDFTKSMVDLLKRNGVEDAQSLLDMAKDLCNLEDEHFHISTLYKSGNHTLSESSVMALGLTQQQKNDYARIIDNKAPLPLWFTTQTKKRQELIKMFAPLVLREDKVIPTQLRDVMIGMRNFYVKITNVDGKSVLQTMHSGAISYESQDPNVAEEMSRGNVEQAQSFISPGRKLVLNSLNSSIADVAVGGLNVEKHIVNQSEKAVAALNNVSAVISPLNAFRLWGARRDFAEYHQILGTLGKKLLDSGLDAKVANFIEHGDRVKDWVNLPFIYYILPDFLVLSRENSKAANAYINNPEADPKIVNAIRVRMELEKPLWQRAISLFQHTNLNIITTMKRVLHDYQDLLGTNVLNYCKSGKDRTGVVEMLASAKAIAATTGVAQAQVLQSSINAGHTQFLAGGQGGSSGAYGIREVGWTGKNFEGVSGHQLSTSSFSHIETTQKIVVRLKRLLQKYGVGSSGAPSNVHLAVGNKKTREDKSL